jgi:hypothetical protein
MEILILDSKSIQSNVFISYGTLNKAKTSLNTQQACILLMRKKVGSTLKEYEFETNKQKI